MLPPQPSKFIKYQWLVNSALCLTVLFTIMILGYVIREYKKQFSSFEQLKQSYNESTLNNKTDDKKIVQKQIDLEVLDQTMQSRPEHIFFDRMRLTQTSPLQIEGTTIQPEEIEGTIQSAENLGLHLKIKQVQSDSEGKVLFELEQL